jgi:tetratricopeptide (TPR) repeat protein
MNPRNHFLAFCGAACAISLVLHLPAAAQQEDDLGTIVGKAIAAMKEEKWEEALALNAYAIERYGKNALQLFGPRFGAIHYRKGLCELKLKRWKEAMDSFEACHKNFPNKDQAGGGNNFEKMALLKWGEAAMGAEEWELAINMFQKFLKERDKTRDNYSEGAFHVGMAICYYKLGRIPEGNEQLEIAIKNKERFPTPDSAIVAGFQALVSGALLKRDEQALLDFINKNRGELVIEPYAMQQYSSVFMKLAGEAVSGDMERAAMALYQFVPSTEAAIDDIRARIKSIGDLRSVKDGTNMLVKSRLESELSALEAERKSKRMTEMVRLGAMAYLHEKHGNIRGAYSAYQQLEAHYPEAEKREDNLFNLVRTSSLVAAGPETQRYAETFVKTFPDSKYVPLVRRLMLSALFTDGEYETCIEVAEPMIDKLEPGSEEHDICLHVLGGSYFYTAQFDKAQPLLDQHVEKYPKSLFEIASNYFRASNVSRLQYWSKAASLLDEFLSKYPDASKNVFMPFALYDRATCHFAEEQLDEALEKLDRVINEFPETNVIDQAYNLRGNVEQSLGNVEKAEEAYLKALEISEVRRNYFVSSEALYSLVALLGEHTPGKEPSPRLKDAVPYADRFWKEFSENSPYQSRAAVAQLHAMDAVGRGDEALERLQKVISELAKDPEAEGLEELINSYTEAYLVKHTPEQLKDHYYNFPDIRAADRAARALLRVAVIGVFENILRKTDDENRRRSGQAMIQVLFQELKNDFALKDLTNFILVKVGDYLRNHTATPREALPYYDEALSRQDQSYRFGALLGRADVYGGSGNSADIEKAIEDFTRVYTDSQEKPEREFALYRIVELLMEKKDYAKAAEQARIYLNREETGFSKYSPQVGLLLARSFDERKMVDDALAMYVKVWAAHTGNIKISAPAMRRWMQLSWDRNKPSNDPAVPADRQGAYEGGAKYIEQTGRFKDKMIESDLELWKEVEKLVKTYEANPNIKSMEQIKREKEAASKRR